MKVNWGYKLVFSLIIFAGIMATMVTLSMNQRVDLVSSDYYRKEIEYQNRIDNHSNALKDGALTFTYDKNNLNVKLKFKEEIKEGQIHLFRPSDATKDQIIRIDVNEDREQILNLLGLEPGFWKIKIDWSSNSDNYYFENVLNIP